MNLKLSCIAVTTMLFALGCEGSVSETPAADRGAEGAPGPEGARGPRGLPGECLRAEREEVQAHSAPLAESDTAEGPALLRASAVCSSGARIVTGGCQWYADGPDAVGSVDPYSSRPIVEGDRDGEVDRPDLEGWICYAIARQGDARGRIHAWAVCEITEP